MLHDAAYFGAEKSQKEPEIWHCEKCDFTTSKIGNWNRHLKTKKHNAACMLHDPSKERPKKSQPTAIEGWTCECGKDFKHHQSLYRHKKTCKVVNGKEDDDQSVEDSGTDTVEKTAQIVTTDGIPQSSDEKDKVIEKLLNVIEEQQKQNAAIGDWMGKHTSVLEKMAERGNQIGNSFNNNTINNTNNIHVYLDKHCSNALSIQDFAARLTLTLSDLGVLRDDEPKAIADVIRKGLVGMGVTERPMHTHKRRWYVKDRVNGWEGDEGGNKIVSTVKEGISHTGLPLLTETAPQWETNERQGALYAETTAALMRDVDSKSATKVLKSIETVCDVKDIGSD